MCNRKTVLVITVLMLALQSAALTGCGQEKQEEMSSVSISKEGEVTHHIVGAFDQSYYDLQGLQTLADERVEEYRGEHGDKSVVLESLEEKDGTVSIKMGYESVEDFAGFNHRDFFSGKIDEAAAAGYELDHVALISMDNKPFEPGDIEGIDEMHVVVIETAPNEELRVTVPGKIQYINQSADSLATVAVTDKKTITIQGHGASQDGEETENVYSYILY